MPIATLDALNIDAPDGMSLVRFYSALTGMPLVDPDEKWPEIGEDGRVPIICQSVDGYQPSTWPTQERGQQMHLDVTVGDLGRAVAAVESLGGRLASEQPGEEWRVMLDPAGHPFCFVPSASPENLGTGIGRWTSLTIDCADGEQLARFYHALFGMNLTDHGGGFFALDEDGKPSIYFQPVDGYQAPTWPTQQRGQQMHLDFYVDDLNHAVAAAEKIGARLAEEQPGDYYRVMLDPAGHPFCLALRRESE